jgi:hypothetical protein
METSKVSVFSPYPFSAGQKINIADGPRKGDWEVVGVTAGKVKLRCPISHREFEWDRFCYHVADRAQPWPGND